MKQYCRGYRGTISCNIKKTYHNETQNNMAGYYWAAKDLNPECVCESLEGNLHKIDRI